MKITDSSYLTVIYQFFVLDRDLVSFVLDQYYEYLQYLPLLLVMFVLAFLLTPIIGQIAQHFGITDKPDHMRETKWNKYDDPSRHDHKAPIPYLGAAAVLIPLLTFSILFFKMQGFIPFLIAGMTVLMISSILDDIFNLPATAQFAFQIIASTLVAISVVDLGVIKIPFDGVIDLQWAVWQGQVWGLDLSFSFPGDLVLILWIAVCTNAVKWMNGVDAVMEGNLVVVFSLLFILGVRTGNVPMTLISIMLVGGLSGFTIFNFPPAKIYSGGLKTLYGFLAATLAAVGLTKLPTAIMVVALPVVDLFYVVITRYIKHKPKNPLDLLRMNDRGHLHHKLVDMNLSKVQVMLIESSISLLFGAFAIFMTGALRLLGIVLAGLTMLFIVILIHTLSAVKSKKKQKKDKATPESKYSY